MDSAQPSGWRLAACMLAVFAVAVTARLSSCYESFWVDELHSAWCVWDSIDDVAQRATAGHQSPFYFFGLWCWKQIVGETEFALRLSSVLAVAATASVVTLSVSRWTGSYVAGAAGGLVIAFERNSLFYGTELRPYAFVMLLMAIAIACFVRLLGVASRHDDRRAWLGLGAATLLMTLFHPTSLGVAAWLTIALFVKWTVTDRSGLLRFNLIDGCLVVSGIACGFALWSSILAETWQQRGAWRSFAQAKSVDQLWAIWDWTYLLLLPCAVAIVALLLGQKNRDRNKSFGTVACLSLLAVVATSVYWIASKVHWVHLWHWRYFVAVLPMFAFIVGGSLSMERVPCAVAKWLRPVAACGLLLGLTCSQGLFAKLDRYPPVLVRRGEDWRGAMAYLQSEARVGDQLRLDSGLVELQDWMRPPRHTPYSVPYPASEQERYLLFPVSGPYRVGTETEYNRYHQQFFLDDGDWHNLLRWESVQTLLESLREENEDKSWRYKRYFLLTRRPANRVDLSELTRSLNPESATIRSFGGVSVIVLSGTASSSD